MASSSSYDPPITRRLPPEVLGHIFAHVSPNELSTLSSTTLVNRDWCKNSVPYLWSAPFSSVFISENLYKIIPVYLSFLSPETRSILIPNEITPSVITQATFDYPSMLEELNFETLYLAVYMWSKHEKRQKSVINPVYRSPYSLETLQVTAFDSENEDDPIVSNSMDVVIYHLVTEICKLLMYRSHKIQNLFFKRSGKLRAVGANANETQLFAWIAVKILDDIPKYPGAIYCLRHLRKLIVVASYWIGKPLLKLSSICHDIVTLEIDDITYRAEESQSTTNELAALIKNQRNLQNFYFRYSPLKTTPIFSALETQAHSLINIEIDDIDIDMKSMESLTRCKNLETLKLIRLRCRGKEAFKPLAHSRFPKLKNFGIKLTKWSYLADRCNEGLSIEDFNSIIKNNGQNLQEIRLEVNFKKYSTTLGVVGEYCPNLVDVTVGGDFDSVDDLVSLLKRPLRLHKLTIRGGASSFNGDGILPPFKELDAMANLRQFSIDWMISATSMATLLENWDAPIIHLMFHCEGDTDSHAKIIQAYFNDQKNKRMLKDVSFAVASDGRDSLIGVGFIEG
ncbi:25068_t:CDS:1 [Cetraspora pellucida]|uniref:25068_t:CDS:1 n=1 Tax=Cetraspora pellucida TaxID=1433469 RepID=A0A9N9ILT6_9GLOM|nr:25068_t:CDS:1 [Cetraspora pellucida]